MVKVTESLSTYSEPYVLSNSAPKVSGLRLDPKTSSEDGDALGRHFVVTTPEIAVKNRPGSCLLKVGLGFRSFRIVCVWV